MEQNGEPKPVMIHLVSKKANRGPSMQVEDELEIMDDSEDELTVVRSNIMRDYSRGSSGSFDQDCNNHLNNHTYKMDSEDLDDDTEEEISRLYEDDDCSNDDNLQPKVVLRDIKAEPEMTNGTTNGHGNDSDEQDTNETFENDAERIMSKRGKKSQNSADYQSEEEQTSSASNEVTENLNDSLEVEKKPIISLPNEILDDLAEAEKSLPNSNRRRIAFTVVQSVPSPIPPPFKRRLTRSTTPKNSEDELEVDNEISFVNGKVDTSGFLSTIHDSPAKGASTDTIKEEPVESKTETPAVESKTETPAVESTPEVESSADEEQEATPMEVVTPMEVATSPKLVATSPKEVATSPKEVATSPKEVATSPKEVATSPKEVATSPKEVATLREVEVVTPMEVTPGDKPEEATPEVKVSEVEVTLEEPKIKETLVKVETVKEEENESIQQSLANSLIEGEDDDDTRSEVSADEESLPSTFSLGSLAWARVGSTVYWPCVITVDPETKGKGDRYTKVLKRRRNGGDTFRREYHLQFFGVRVQRAWVVSSNMLKFEGLKNFNELAENVTKKDLCFFKPQKSIRQVWNDATTACSKLMKKSNQERLNVSTKLWENKDNVKTNATSKKRRRGSCESPLPNEQPKTKRPKLVLKAEKLIDSIPLKVLEENKRKLKTGFKLFQLANKEACIKKQGEEKIDTVLSEMWTKATKEEKNLYHEKSTSILKVQDANESADEAIETPVASPSVNGNANDKIQVSVSKRGRKSKNFQPELDYVVRDESIEDPEDKPLAKIPKKDGRGRPPKTPKIANSEIAKTPKTANSTPKTANGTPKIANGTPKTANSSKGISSKSALDPQEKLEKLEKSRENMVGLFKKESCCIICEEVSQEPNDMIKCRGACGGNSFHITCLPDEFNPENMQSTLEKWKCPECGTNKHKCQLCKDDPIMEKPIKCNVTNCGRFFHPQCLQKNGLWPQHRLTGDKTLTCPVHVCHTCASDNPKDPYMKYNSKLVKCIRCPTAYHSGDYCVAAGSLQITASQIICPKHYTPPKKKKIIHHVNTSWCFICSKGGALICCESCPASFHVDCLKIPDLNPEAKYFCDNCETGRMHLYGEVTWVKLGHYRWWPARVLHPSEVPANIEKLKHDVGEFPIQFCGSNEYAWMNRGRSFLYEENDSEKVPNMDHKGGLDGAYKRGLSEAAEFFEKYSQERQKRETAIASKAKPSSAKPPHFNKIKSNLAIPPCVVQKPDPFDKNLCDCSPDADNACGPDSDCINRDLMTECLNFCKAGDKCLNQRFQRRQYPTLKVLRTPTRGWGLHVLQPVKKGDFLIEYVGELITMDEFRKRIDDSIGRKEEQNYYYMSMDSQRMLDAGPRGNIARFINHSCDPNAETQKWTVNNDTRVGLFALEDIPANTELTFNYQFESMGEVKKACLCGAKNCSGFIGKKSKKERKEAKGHEEKKDKEKKKKKKKFKVKVKKHADKETGKKWEDLCFRCFDEGEVLMCDWKACPKVYHLACLGRQKRPGEVWYCPWHHCVQCGKTAVSHCIHCPNAYCKAHNSVLKKHKELGSICDEHKDDIMDLIMFYRAVGGIKHLVPNPNVPLTEVRPYLLTSGSDETGNEKDSNDNNAKLKPSSTSNGQVAKIKKTRGKENAGLESPATPAAGAGTPKLKTTPSGTPKLKATPNATPAGTPKLKATPKATPTETPPPSRSQTPTTPFGQRNPFQYKCKLEGCEFRTRRTRLKAHYINTHKMEEPEAEKLVPARLISTSDTQRMNCPLCEHRCLPIMLRKHLFRAHSKDLNLEEINMVFEEAIKCKASTEKAQALAAAVAAGSPLPADGILEDELESNPLFSKVQPDGRIACKAPNCSKMVSAQNIARHWNQEHSSLKKDDFQPSMRKLIRMIQNDHSESDTPVTPAPKVVPKDTPSALAKSNPPSKSPKTPQTPTITAISNKQVTPLNKTKQEKTIKKTPVSEKETVFNKRISCGSSGCGYRTTSNLKMTAHRKDQGHLSPKKTRKTQSPASSNLIIGHCSVGDCDFSTKYKSNLMRHRQRRNHFLSEEDRITAKAEASRDELFREIEQKPIPVDSADESGSNDEVDVTIPLTKDTSPSKITDYFKPKPKNLTLKKALNLEAEVEPTKNTTNAASSKTPEAARKPVPMDKSYKSPITVLEQ